MVTMIVFKILDFFFRFRLLNKNISSILVYQNQILIIVSNSRDIPKIAYIFKQHTNLRTTSMLDIMVVDYYQHRLSRFQLTYYIVSILRRSRLFLRTLIYKEDLTELNASDQNFHLLVPSILPTFASANWLEREASELFGILFEAHGDLRRLLTDYGFEGYPLRKDFPLCGFYELRFSNELQRIVSQPVSFTQEYRVFKFTQPWS